jgi:hypothetical protein
MSSVDNKSLTSFTEVFKQALKSLNLNEYPCINVKQNNVIILNIFSYEFEF